MKEIRVKLREIRVRRERNGGSSFIKEKSTNSELKMNVEGRFGRIGFHERIPRRR